ncbi:MAG TPA: hypothetical protein VKR31_17775 [Rhizomicrobium sp.]|nr:hypothetical protein [Rhizomicrobium sp.]
MRLSFLAGLALAGLLSFSARAHIKAEPRFVVLPNHFDRAPHHPSSTLPQWTGSFTDLTNKTVRYTMIGTDPAYTNDSTTVSVVLVPIKIVYGKENGNRPFDPHHVLANGRTVVKNTLDSPVFQSGIDFVQDGVDLGNTQYLDAFQRGNFWSSVETHRNYHVLLNAPTVLTERTIDVATFEGRVIRNPFAAGYVGIMDINDFDARLQSFMHYLRAHINPGVLPVFLTYDVFLTDSGKCCIGGYHSANGARPDGQTYAFATYVVSTGSFAQDVSALSHEIGEWIDDPFVDNNVNCSDNGLMEVGDPLEGGPNYGAYRYTLNGFTYNLQSLVFMDYFGAPPTSRVNDWYSFQDDEGGVCPGQ